MTRSDERFMRRSLWLASAAFLSAAAVLGYRVLFETGADANDAASRGGAAIAAGTIQASEPQKCDPKLAKLLAAKMSRTVVGPVSAVAAVAPKPAVPALSSLLKLKGITDYGNPKLNEAVIENMRGGAVAPEVGFYKAGENVRGVDALVLQVGSDVLLRYDSREIRLYVAGDESAEALPVANPSALDVEKLVTATGSRTRTKP